MCDKALCDAAARMTRSGDKYHANWGSLLEYIDMSTPNEITEMLFTALPHNESFSVSPDLNATQPIAATTHSRVPTARIGWRRRLRSQPRQDERRYMNLTMRQPKLVPSKQQSTRPRDLSEDYYAPHRGAK